MKTILISLYAMTLLCYGTGFEQPFQDPKATARGNAYVATADNPSAVHYNPAGLVWQKETSIQFVSIFSHVDVNLKNSPNDFRHIQNIPAISFFMNYKPKNNDKLAFGFGFTVPHGLGLDYGDDFALRTLATDAYLAHLTFSPSVSYKINDKLSIGANLNYSYDDYEAKQGLVTPGDFFKFKGSGDGWGYSLGIMYRPNSKWSFGANYRSSIKTNISGTATTNAIAPRTFFLEEPASTSFNYPQQVVIGARYNFNKTWNAELNAQWTDWSSIKQGKFKVPSGDISKNLLFEDTLLIGIGATKKLTENTNLHFGYLISTPAAPASTFQPLTPNSEYNAISIGLDHKFNKWEISTSLTYAETRSRRISGSPTGFTGVSADGTWKTKGLTFLLGGKYSF